MSVNQGLFTSDSIEYETPQELFDTLNEEFGFTLDVCATAENTKCFTYFDKYADGLAQDWGIDVCWMNPPYGREIGKWVKKACESSVAGAIVVCLLPARTDTKYWHDYVMKAREIRFIKGRLRFGDTKNSAPFPSCIVVFAETGSFSPTVFSIDKTGNLLVPGADKSK